MELEKTTWLSVLVWVAGVLAEVIFRDALSKSMFGIVLSIVLAVIVVVSTYFIIDGVNIILKKQRKESEDRQYEYQEKMFQMLDDKLEEQIRLEKSIYESLNDIGTSSKGYMEKAAEAMFENASETGSDKSMTIEEAVEAINANTLHVAKLIAKYQVKNSESVRDELVEIKGRIPEAQDILSGINSDSGLNSELLENNRELLANSEELAKSNKELITNSEQLVESNKELITNSEQLVESNKELITNSEQLVEGNKELIANSEQLVEGNRELITNSGQLVEGNKELFAKLVQLEEAVNKIETVKADEITAYIDKVISGINTQMMKNAFVSQRPASRPVATKAAATKKPESEVKPAMRTKPESETKSAMRTKPATEAASADTAPKSTAKTAVSALERLKTGSNTSK